MGDVELLYTRIQGQIMIKTSSMVVPRPPYKTNYGNTITPYITTYIKSYTRYRPRPDINLWYTIPYTVSINKEGGIF